MNADKIFLYDFIKWRQSIPPGEYIRKDEIQDIRRLQASAVKHVI